MRVSPVHIFFHPEKESDSDNYCSPMKEAAIEKVQTAVDKHFTGNNIDVVDIENLLREHMRTPYTMGKNDL